MVKNGNGYNGRFTAQQFIDAMPGTGGIISALADRCDCAWHTARKAVDRWPTVKQAWQNERAKVNDKAQHNVISAINGGDLQTSKWWLQVMDPEFTPKQKADLTSGDEPIRILVGGINLADDV